MKRVMYILIIFTLFLPVSIITNCSKMPSSPTRVGEIQPGYDYTAEDSMLYEMDLENISELRVENVNGRVEVQENLSLRQVQVQVVKRVRSFSLEDARACLSHIEVLMEKGSREILVKSLQPATSYERDYCVDYLIRLPRNIDVHVSSQNGQIILAEILGSVYIHSENGSVSGDISLPDTGVMDVQLINGSIDLNIPATTNATFSASTENGDIQLIGLVLQNRVRSAQLLQGLLGNGSGIIDLSTTNGNIELTSM